MHRLSLALVAAVTLGTSTDANAFNITFETIDCDGQTGFVSVPVEYIYRIDTIKSDGAVVVLPQKKTNATKRQANNIRILNSAEAAKPATRSDESTRRTDRCASIELNPATVRRVSVRRPDLETVRFDVFYVTASEAKNLTLDIKRYMAARRTSLERGSSITVETK